MGLRVGSDRAPVQIVEFIDLECPFCATFEESIQPILREYPQSVTRTLIHFPLSMHSQARRAAHVFECGAQLADPNAMLQALYRRQREYGEDAWIEAARDAGVADTARFRECVARPEAHPRIEAGYQLSRALDIGGTPTVIINGFLYPSPPTDSMMRTVISDALAGEPAASTKRKRPTRRVLEEWIVPLSPAEQSR